jgi:hypothetical protein
MIGRLVVIVISPLLLTVQGFSIDTVNSAVSTRSSFFKDVSVIAAGVLVFAPNVAGATDIRSKLASSAALRNVKSSQKKLTTLVDYIQLGDYAGLKEALRASPFSDLRKSMSTLVKSGEDGPDSDKLQTTYKTFIVALETLDSTASLAVRGRKISAEQMSSLYVACEDALGSFLVLAEETALVPMQDEASS